MKKSLLALAIFSTLPFSSVYCVSREQATFGVGCLTIVGVAGTYYYYYHYKPSLNKTNTTNNPAKTTPTQVAVTNSNKTLMNLVQERFPQAPITEIKTEVNTPKILPVTQQTEKKTMTEVISEKVSNPTIVTETTNNVEPIAKTESCFLNNVRNSIEKMNLERLLLENMDVLEG